MNADRELLIAILAYDKRFINREELLAGLRAWVADKSQPFIHVLGKQGALLGSWQSRLEEVVRKHLAAHGDDPQRGLSAIVELDSLRTELERIGDDDLRVSLKRIGDRRGSPVQVHASNDTGGRGAGRQEQLPTRPLPHGSPISNPLDLSPLSDVVLVELDESKPSMRGDSSGAAEAGASRYNVLRPHARGGLGEVFVARDEELNREVALKEIQSAHADNPDSRARFLQEAEITGALEHPGIVPVYGLGHHPDGRPYYAMRFIKGDSLKEAIIRFHAQSGHAPDAGARQLELRKLLGRFIDVCNAIEYAHSRGVVHRDLKPGNIMLGKYGETLVVDWGLAKAVGRADLASSTVEILFDAGSASGSAPTQMGTAIGTPQYMSPEQAAGRLDQLGPASDVYSLGATLYCLLVGRPPVDETQRELVLARVQAGSFARPRQVNKDIDRVLESICLKAMALHPADRYASPRKLADDIEHWLADEPVQAHRSTSLERLARWSRRHRAWARAGALMLVLVALVAVVAGGFVESARRDAQDQRDAATQALQSEMLARRQARAAIDSYVKVLTHDPSLADARMQPLKQRLLSEALAYYRKFIRTHRHDPASRHELARAIFKVAEISRMQGLNESALRAHREALDILARLVREHEDNSEYQSDLAVSYNHLGTLFDELDRHPEAQDSFAQAIAIQSRLVEQHPEIRGYRLDLANTHNNLAVLQLAMGEIRSARASHAKAIESKQWLTRADPHDSQFQGTLANSYTNLGVLEHRMGNYQAARAQYDRSLAIQGRLAKKEPKNTELQSHLATTLHDLAVLEQELGNRQSARRHFERALAIRAGVAQRDPSVSEYRRDEANTLRDLGLLLAGEGDWDAAVTHLKQAADASRLLADPHELYESARTLAQCAALIRTQRGAGADLDRIETQLVTAAVDAVRDALAAGLDDGIWKSDTDLAPITKRPEFRQMLENEAAGATEGRKDKST